MKIFIGADHRGYKDKGKLLAKLGKSGYEVVDAGTHEEGVTCDYPEIAYKVAKEVASSDNARGILICMTGLGHSIVANKVPGAYATLCYNKETAVFARQHNNSNILILAAKYVTDDQMYEIVDIWLKEKFEIGGRHERRFNQIREIEKRICKGA